MYDATPTRPLPRRRTGRLVLIVVATVVGGCCIAGVSATVVGGWLSNSASTAGDPSNATPTAAGLNQPVRDGQFEFTVRSMTCAKSTIDNGWLHAEAKGQFCVAEVTLTNIGKEARRFADGWQQALGPDGEHYAADTGAGVVANGNGEAVWDVINPGITIATKIVYDIPVGAAIATLVLHDAPLSGGVTVSLAP